MTPKKEYERLVRGEINPELVAFGQALAEEVVKVKLTPGHRLIIEVEFEERLEVKMTLEQPNLVAELWLDYKGEWKLIGAPHIVIPY